MNDHRLDLSPPRAGRDGAHRPPRWRSLMWLALGGLAYGVIQIALLLCGPVGWVMEHVIDAWQRVVRRQGKP